MMSASLSKKRLALGRWRKLNWTSTPSRWLPHGLTGALSVVLGMKITTDSLMGRASSYNPHQEDYTDAHWTNLIPISSVAFAIMAFENALSGYKLAPTAMKDTQIMFRCSAVFQMCMCHFIIRFLPHFTILWRFVLDEVVNASEYRWAKPMLEHTLWAVDCGVTGVSLCAILTSWWFGLQFVWQKSKEIAIALTAGTFGILLLAVYPVQLAVRGQEWYECVQRRYSHQAIGMVAYIYIPASMTFSMILFGATLYLRRIISDRVFGICSALIVLVCLVGTVLSQEIHIPYISTQRIYLPCIEPEAGTTEYAVVQALDFSLYSRALLTTFLGLKFENDEF